MPLIRHCMPEDQPEPVAESPKSDLPQMAQRGTKGGRCGISPDAVGAGCDEVCVIAMATFNLDLSTMKDAAELFPELSDHIGADTDKDLRDRRLISTNLPSRIFRLPCRGD